MLCSWDKYWTTFGQKMPFLRSLSYKKKIPWIFSKEKVHSTDFCQRWSSYLSTGKGTGSYMTTNHPPSLHFLLVARRYLFSSRLWAPQEQSVSVRACMHLEQWNVSLFGTSQGYLNINIIKYSKSKKEKAENKGRRKCIQFLESMCKA